MPVYLDNAATTRVCPEAARAALEAMTEGYLSLIHISEPTRH